MFAVVSISLIIVAIVIILAVVTTSKAYTFKHTVDPIDPSEQLHDAQQVEHEK